MEYTETATITTAVQGTERYAGFLDLLGRPFNEQSRQAVMEAFEMARTALDGMVRYDGTPLFDHSVRTAEIVISEIGLGRNSTISTLLHDVARLGLADADEIEKRFGSIPVSILEGLNLISKVHTKVSMSQADNFRDLIVSYSTDPRIILIKLADRLHKTREKAAAGFEKHILSTLARLGMPETVFRIALTPLAEPGRTGRDSVQFLFTANPRMTPQPVERIASGGELSRVMLALKALLAERMQLPTIIFDEIDTGVSGRIADAMGEIIASLSASMQVVDITHLPQVASKGTAHFVVYKRGGRTDITRLGDEERVTEIAKMLSGSRITDAAIAQARILLGK